MGDYKMLPTYPVYIPSRGRPTSSVTAKLCVRDSVPFRICVAPFEEQEYRRAWGDATLTLPSDDMDIVAVRNWIRDHAEALGAEKHWQLDDNIARFCRRYKAKRIPCTVGIALRMCEIFSDRYSNIALSGLQYDMFLPDGQKAPPFVTNCKVYSCTLVNHAMPYRWRGPYNDDTDLCLQALAGGWCTVSLNAFTQAKITTMKMKGGMNDANAANYQGDGRVKMARTLERRWPGVVETRRRFRRAQHYVANDWRKFDTPLKLKEGIDLEALREQGTNEFDMQLSQLREPRSERIRGYVEEFNQERGQ